MPHIPDREHPQAGARGARARRAAAVLAAAAVVSTAGGVAAAASTAGDRPVEPPAVQADSGKAWDRPVQDAQPNPRAVAPRERGRWSSAQERRERVRPQGPATLPAAPGRSLVTDPDEVAR